jgi:hypothetical protein
MCRANRKNILKTECGKFVGSRLVFRVIDFVNEKQDGFVQFPNQASQFAIHRIYPVLPVHHKKNEIALSHRQFCGRPHLVRQLGFPRTDNPAGIPKPESFPTDFAFSGNPVPCDPWLAVHNGDATAGNSIEQCRFSYIWPAGDGNVHHDERSTGILPVWQTGILSVFVPMTTQGARNDEMTRLRYATAR